ncbi:Rogdi leucine zipper containing protein-domain-containing protein [Aspergillus karnatakaensis]|uniref:tRNA methyltransferase RSM22 n=1 Tax=Aspergillus karnatakaensis TaxID=1810916 RepID=UPI003CCCA729
MATWVYPPLHPDHLEKEADSALSNELEWLLRSLQDSLASLREGLQECTALLAPKEPGSTLVLSSMRSESVKGFVTRVGTKVVKGVSSSRVSISRGAPATRLCLSNLPDAPELALGQLVSVRDSVRQCLDIVDVSTWTGDPLDARFIYSQLHLLGETIAEGRQMLKGESDAIRGKWWETSAPENMFDPPLPTYLSFHLSIADSALVLYLRILESSTPAHTPTAFAPDISLTGFSIRDRLFGPRQPLHDEAGDVFSWKGDDVKVKEKSPTDSELPKANQEDAVLDLIEKITATEAEILELLDELDLTDEYSGTAHEEVEELEEEFEEDLEQALEEVAEEPFQLPEDVTVEERVQIARQRFGETLPEELLNEEETLLYSRLYGEPIYSQPGLDEVEDAEVENEQDLDTLLRHDGEGGWKEVPYEAQETDDIPVVYDMEAPPVEETDIMRRTREVAEQLGAEVIEGDHVDAEDSASRYHPRTVEGKFGTDPSTIFPPKNTLTGPISIMLSNYSNKHISDAAHKAFGGRGLPHSTSTPPPRAQVPQKPIGLDPTQRFMTDMEANAYLAVLYPAMYASSLSILSEVRKRLGSDWLRSLMTQENGPNVLDASAGGAGILAWRDVLRAEYEVMVPDHPKDAPYPLGRATVITGSDPLRTRASLMLENTTFLPRLPDYLHIRESPTLDDTRAPRRKQFDVIIAPHALLGLDEDYTRKDYVENLWALLNPNGGVLILIEKGHHRGFEAIAGAREMLLKRKISSPGSTEFNELTESSNENTKVQKEPGMIVAPCTNHERCPMYTVEGHAKGRKDYCHFEQRYIRPPFLQRILGAKDRNHEDLKISYLAVQRGVDLRQTEKIVQGKAATDAAFEGYEHTNEVTDEATTGEAGSTEPTSSPQPDEKFHTLSLPRAVYPPMKRRGHVIFDLCTPAGKIERWTVPRSFSRPAFKDARKARWGDLWALGAKTRISRNLNLGDKHGEGKKERLARRAAERAELNEEEGDGEGLDVDDLREPGLDEIAPRRKKGEHIPSWKKYNDKKKARQAFKKQTRNDFGI